MARPKKDWVPFSVSIDRELLEAVRECSKKKKMTLTATVEELFERGLASIEDEDKPRQAFLDRCDN